MEMRNCWKQILRRVLSYVLVAALASVATLFIAGENGYGKLGQLYGVIQTKYIGSTEKDALLDAAADAMVEAVGDRWSYYMSAEEYTAYTERKSNTYVGVGITVRDREDGNGYDIITVEAEGPAAKAGILPGDILTAVDGQPAGEIDVTAAIRGEPGTEVAFSILRGESTYNFTVQRATIAKVIASGQMLPGKIGLVTIKNFNSECCNQAKAAVEDLVEQGAQSLIFDVRNNPGGYLSELTELLDYLLPEGVLLKSVEYTGLESEDKSDAACVELPMAVLINANSYSAAEFFAAALSEYDWAVVVGERTTGKGYYQRVYTLSDGSAVNLSVGKYFTPKGVSLVDTDGLAPDVEVLLDTETAKRLSAKTLPPQEDPQVQAAVLALQEG